MNNDRLLTRVFDKQEKKMLFEGDYIGRYYIIESITAAGIKVYVLFEEMEEMRHIPIGNYCDYERYKILPFGDRFAPMQCSGYKDKNKKLIYADDMVTGLYDDYELAETLGYISGGNFKIVNGLVKFEEGCFEIYEIDCSDINDHEDFSCYMKMAKDIEIIGNKWEQPELWELKTNEIQK